MSNEKKIELKSEDINDILSRPPRWIIRWGNFLMIVIVIFLFIISARFKFPENVNVPVTISSGLVQVGTIILPESKIKKIKYGQRTLIFIKKYPHTVYGSINAVVSGISPASGKTGNHDFYIINLHFPEGLVTDKGLDITASSISEGEAVIMTGETSILERIYNPLKHIIR